VLVIEGRRDFGSRSRAAGNRVGIVETDRTLAIRSVQSQRIIEAVRLGRADRNTLRDKPDPVPALRINNENLPVQIKQGVEGWIALYLFMIIT